MVVAQPSNTQNLTTSFALKINGATLPPLMTTAIEEVCVEETLHLPAMATLRLHINNMDWLSSGPLVEGAKLDITVMEDRSPLPLFKGIIAGVEPDLSIEMPLLTVRAYDYSFKLHRRLRRKAYLNVTDGDIVRQLASDSGLSPRVDDPGITHPYLFQNNISDYEFILQRARLTGFDLYVDGDTLHFRRPHQSQAGPTLQYGTSLHRFRPRSTTFEPVTRVTVRGWDPKAKREIVGSASSAGGLPQIGQSRPGHSLASSTWGGGQELVVTHCNVESAKEAERLATSYIDELNGSHIEAEGLCNGNARLRLLRQIEIKDVGQRFSGKYILTGVVHTYTNRGHQTTFTAHARRSATVHDLLNGTRSPAEMSGPVIGLVTNINDPDGLGRVKVKFPWLASDQESNWARIASPLSGGSRGANFLPEINDEVLVAFEHGDINFPYIIGGLWNGKDKPPVPPSLPGPERDDKLLKGGNGAVKSRLLKSTKGNMLIFNDSDGGPGVFLVGSSGAYIMVDDATGEEKLALADKTRNNRIEIRSKDNSIVIQNDGDIIINTKGNLKATIQGNLEATVQGNLTAKVAGNANIEATGSLTLKSTASVTVEATGSLTLKGATVSVEGQGSASLRAPSISVNGSASTSIQGGAVTISGMPLKLN